MTLFKVFVVKFHLNTSTLSMLTLKRFSKHIFFIQFLMDKEYFFTSRLEASSLDTRIGTKQNW